MVLLGTYKVTKSTYQPGINESFWDNTLVLIVWNEKILWVNNGNKIKIYDSWCYKTGKILTGADDYNSDYNTIITSDICNQFDDSYGYNWISNCQKYSAYQDFIIFPNGGTFWHY